MVTRYLPERSRGAILQSACPALRWSRKICFLILWDLTGFCNHLQSFFCFQSTINLYPSNLQFSILQYITPTGFLFHGWGFFIYKYITTTWLIPLCPSHCLLPSDFPLSLFIFHYSLFHLTYHPFGVNPLLPIAYCLFPIPYCLPIFSFSLVTRHFQLATFTSSLSIHHSFNPPIINPTILTTTGSHQPSNHILYFNRKLSKII